MTMYAVGAVAGGADAAAGWATAGAMAVTASAAASADTRWTRGLRNIAPLRGKRLVTRPGRSPEGRYGVKRPALIPVEI
ncbi:hypothetical protein GCM10018953_40060 [Streptosporangium nondiastaticum]